MDYRRKLWINILKDLGPPEGCIVPLWLRIVYTFLFPLHGMRVLLGDAVGFDYLRLVWRIHGVDYSDCLFAQLAACDGSLYRFTKSHGVVTIERIAPKQASDHALPVPGAEVGQP